MCQTKHLNAKLKHEKAYLDFTEEVLMGGPNKEKAEWEGLKTG